jgi:hypothetical protein
MYKSLVFTTLLAIYSLQVNAQPTPNKLYFELGKSLTVTQNGQAMPSAWCGGLNNPQFSLADLNNDHKQDLVVYEQYIGVRTFINTGVAGNPNYVYDPQYEAKFPSDISDYLKLVDYNRDGIADLIHKGQSGFVVYTGYYANNQLCFNFYKELWYFDPHSGAPPGNWINAYCQPGDIPAVADVDNDGDLDFLAYDVWGGAIQFYRNCQVEDGLPKDSIRLCLKDMCWGRSYQTYSRSLNLGYACSEYALTCQKSTKTTHSGNTILIFDYDGDGDKDMLNGNISFSDIQFLRNGRAQISGSTLDSMTSQDSIWASNGHALRTDIFPSAYWLDIDQDGKNDLVFSPHAKNYENYNCVTFYKNTGTSTPNYIWQSDSYLMDQMIDMGYGTYPAYYDYNKDGKPDLFIGSDGFYQQSSGTLRSSVSYFQNISTSTSSSFDKITGDFLGLNAMNIQGAAPAFGDLNNDGKDDMVLGLTDGTMLFFKNNAASNSVQPDWVYVGTIQYLDINNNYKNVDVGSYAAPFIYDIDNDGKPDLLIGNQSGNLYYYKNTNVTPGVVSVTKVTDKLGGILLNVQGYPYAYSTPFIGPIDNTGKKYLLIGNSSGTVYRYDGFQNGNVTTPYTLVDAKYSDIQVGPRSAPAVADINADTMYDMILGNELGGVNYYAQLFPVGIKDKVFDNKNVTVYPNPAKDNVNISWDVSFVQSEINISVISVTGQKMITKTVPATQLSTQLSTQGLQTGVYYFILKSGNNTSVNPVTIIN